MTSLSTVMILALGTLGACGGGSDTSPDGSVDAFVQACTLEEFIQRDTGATVLQDCGDLRASSEDATALAAMRTCAIDAAAAKTPFEIEFFPSLIDGGSVYAFVGSGTGAAFHIDRYETSYSKDTEVLPRRYRTNCLVFAENADQDCASRNGCLTCSPSAVVDTCGTPE